MSTRKKSTPAGPIVTEEMFTAAARKPLDHKEARAAAILAIERVALTARDDATAEDHFTALQSLAALSWQVSWCQDGLVGKMRAAGATWQTIGDALDVTRSAVQQKYGN
jgi:pectin methylesterase-like acyl-CoA thioesterase